MTIQDTKNSYLLNDIKHYFVDEYDNTALALGTNPPLLGRGFTHVVILSPGESWTVTVTMVDKGTIVHICGAAPTGGVGTAGESVPLLCEHQVSLVLHAQK